MSALDLTIAAYGLAFLLAAWRREDLLTGAFAAITVGLALMRWGLSCPS